MEEILPRSTVIAYLKGFDLIYQGCAIEQLKLNLPSEKFTSKL